MDARIEAYIDKIVKELNCANDEKRELMDEMRDHLTLLKREYTDQGFSDEEAVQKAIESFGEEKQLTNGLQASMSPFYKVFMKGAWILFGLYSFIALYKLIFERIIVRIADYYRLGEPFNRFFFSTQNTKGYFEHLQLNSNIIPFKNTFDYLRGSIIANTDVIINNTLGNILVFLPLGLFLPLLFKKYSKFTKTVAAAALMSFAIEVIQITMRLGQFDIDDVILNTLGAGVGFLFYKLIKGIITLPKGRIFRRIPN